MRLASASWRASHIRGECDGYGRHIDGALGAKRIALLREILPNAMRLGLLGDPTDPTSKVEGEVLGPVAGNLE